MTFIRVILALIVIKDLVVYFFSADYLFGPSAIVPYAMYHSILKLYKISFLEINFNSLLLTRLYLLASLVAAIALLLGVRKLLFGLLLCASLLLLKMRNIFILDGGDNLIQVLLPFIAISESLPLLESAKHAGPATGRLAAVRHTLGRLGSYGIRLEVCYVYFFAFLHKLPGPLWLDGTATYYVMRTAEFQGTSLNIWLTQSAFFVKFTTYSTLVWEALFPFLIWTRGFPKYALLGFSVLMHLGILLFMRIDNYSVVMLTAYCAFLTNAEFLAIKNLFAFGKQKATMHTAPL